eukprot:1156497-Pelagomonas_calceolata.AAC.2
MAAALCVLATGSERNGGRQGSEARGLDAARLGRLIGGKELDQDLDRVRLLGGSLWGDRACGSQLKYLGVLLRCDGKMNAATSQMARNFMGGIARVVGNVWAVVSTMLKQPGL